MPTDLGTTGAPAATILIGGDFSLLERQAADTVRRVQLQFSKAYLGGSSFTRPLGEISGKAEEFGKSMAAANARVLAFGATAGVLYSVIRAFNEMVKSTVEVNKALVGINVFLGKSQSGLLQFGKDLANIASTTGQSFDEIAKGATELARQGLGAEETLLRIRDAAMLTRQSGMDLEASVESLTATINSFSKDALKSTEIINKFANVDSAFAVSSKDLAEAMKRVGSSASEAGVGIDELVALVTVAQQTTARGGAVIGNALKTIFTRIERPAVLAQLKEVGVEVEDLGGKVRPTIDILRSFSKVYDTLGEGQQSKLAEKVGNIYQINILKALISDLSKEYGNFDKALKVSMDSTDQAQQRNEEYNKSLEAMINKTGVLVKQLGSKIGNITVAPIIKGLMETLTDLTQLSESDSFGVNLAEGMLKGFTNFLKGPGLALLGAGIFSLTKNLAVFISKASQEFFKFNESTKIQTDLQLKLQATLAAQPQLIESIITGKISQVEFEKQLLALATQRLNIEKALSTVVGQAAFNYTSQGQLTVDKKGNLTTPQKKASGGLVPQTDLESSYIAETVGAITGGYRPGNIRRMSVKGLGQVVYNDREIVKDFGFEQPAIMPPVQSKAGKEYKVKFEKIHGFNPYTENPLKNNFSSGYVPNFAKTLHGYHGTLNTNAPTIEKEGIVPQVGNFVKDMYGDYEPTPLAFMADRRELRKAVNAMKYHVAKRLGKHMSKVTKEDIREHGLLVKAEIDDNTYKMMEDGRSRNVLGGDIINNTPVSVEVGDLYSSEGFETKSMYKGARLVEFLKRTNMAAQGYIPKRNLSRLRIADSRGYVKPSETAGVGILGYLGVNHPEVLSSIDKQDSLEDLIGVIEKSNPKIIDDFVKHGFAKWAAHGAVPNFATYKGKHLSTQTLKERLSAGIDKGMYFSDFYNRYAKENPLSGSQRDMFNKIYASQSYGAQDKLVLESAVNIYKKFQKTGDTNASAYTEDLTKLGLVNDRLIALQKVLDGKELTSRKTGVYYRALSGDSSAVPVDRNVINTALDKTLKHGVNISKSLRRKIARSLTEVSEEKGLEPRAGQAAIFAGRSKFKPSFDPFSEAFKSLTYAEGLIPSYAAIDRKQAMFDFFKTSLTKNIPEEGLQAILNSGGKITGDKYVLPVERYQKVDQGTYPSVRGGVFYLPKGSYHASGYNSDKHLYGGSTKIEGERTFATPLMVKGTTGGKVPERAYAQLFGKSAYKELKKDVIGAVGDWINYAYGYSNRFNTDRVQDFLKKYAPEHETNLQYILENSQKGNQLRYALQELAIGQSVKDVGFDSIMGYTNGRGVRSRKPALQEIFALNEEYYPFAKGFVPPIRNPNFKKLFTGTKVIDKKGKPLRMYHGTASKEDFTTFAVDKRGYTYGEGAYFTPETSRASEYSKKNRSGDSYPEGARVYPTYLNIKNPYITSSDAGVNDIGIKMFNKNQEEYFRIAKKIAEKKRYTGPNAVSPTEVGNYWLREQGYDGIFKKWSDDEIIEAVAFYPNQIKSAIGNSGAFSPLDSDITKATGLIPNYTRFIPRRQRGKRLGAGAYGAFYDLNKKIQGTPIGVKRFNEYASEESIEKEYKLAKFLSETPVHPVITAPKVFGSLERSLADRRVGKSVASGKTGDAIFDELDYYNTGNPLFVPFGHLFGSFANFAKDKFKDVRLEAYDLHEGNFVMNEVAEKYLRKAAKTPAFAEKLLDSSALQERYFSYLAKKGGRFSMIDAGGFNKYASGLIPSYATPRRERGIPKGRGAFGHFFDLKKQLGGKPVGIKRFLSSDPKHGISGASDFEIASEFEIAKQISEKPVHPFISAPKVFGTIERSVRDRRIGKEVVQGKTGWDFMSDTYKWNDKDAVSEYDSLFKYPLYHALEAFTSFAWRKFNKVGINPNDLHENNYIVNEKAQQYLSKVARNPKFTEKLRHDEKLQDRYFSYLAQKGGNFSMIDPGAFVQYARGYVPPAQNPNFRKWFEGSKVVDTEGNPLRVFHGTGEDFNVFKPSSYGAYGAGMYFINSPEVAGGYTGKNPLGEKKKGFGNIKPAFVNLKNPLVVDFADGAFMQGQIFQKLGMTKEKAYQKAEKILETKGVFTKEIKTMAERQGYDGIIAKKGNLQEIVAFRPEQIKSATGNNGEFSPLSRDITKSRGFVPPLQNPNFQKWFGGSKVVDKDGKPLKVYHGTSKDTDYNTFNINERGHFFTKSPHYASSYAESNLSMKPVWDESTQSYKTENTASRVIPAYLNIKNPKVIFNQDLDASNHYKAESIAAKKAKADGYDGIIYRDKDGIASDQYIAFYPEQIKSVTGNNGEFSPLSKDITKAEGLVPNFMPRIGRREAVNLIHGTRDKGEIFYVEFIKRTTGELRKMKARLDVRKHLKGGPTAYNFSDNNLISVFDMDKMDYRSIPYEGIQKLSLGGEKYDIGAKGLVPNYAYLPLITPLLGKVITNVTKFNGGFDFKEAFGDTLANVKEMGFKKSFKKILKDEPLFNPSTPYSSLGLSEFGFRKMFGLEPRKGFEVPNQVGIIPTGKRTYTLSKQNQVDMILDNFSSLKNLSETPDKISGVQTNFDLGNYVIKYDKNRKALEWQDTWDFNLHPHEKFSYKEAFKELKDRFLPKGYIKDIFGELKTEKGIKNKVNFLKDEVLNSIKFAASTKHAKNPDTASSAIDVSYGDSQLTRMFRHLISKVTAPVTFGGKLSKEDFDFSSNFKNRYQLRDTTNVPVKPIHNPNAGYHNYTETRNQYDFRYQKWVKQQTSTLSRLKAIQDAKYHLPVKGSHDNPFLKHYSNQQIDLDDVPFANGLVPNYAYFPLITPLIGRIATNVTHSGGGFGSHALEPAIESIKKLGWKESFKRILKDKPLYKEDDFFGIRESGGDLGISDFAFRKMFGLKPRFEPKNTPIPIGKNTYTFNKQTLERFKEGMVSGRQKESPYSFSAVGDSADLGKYMIYLDKHKKVLRWEDTWDFNLHPHEKFSYKEAFKEANEILIKPTVERFKENFPTTGSFKDKLKFITKPSKYLAIENLNNDIHDPIADQSYGSTHLTGMLRHLMSKVTSPVTFKGTYQLDNDGMELTKDDLGFNYLEQKPLNPNIKTKSKYFASSFRKQYDLLGDRFIKQEKISDRFLLSDFRNASKASWEIQKALQDEKLQGLSRGSDKNPFLALGLIPHFSALDEAISREKAAGVATHQIKVGQDFSLKSAANPMGLGVYNLRDEPQGLQQGIRRAIKEGSNPKTYGTKRNVPNFATPYGRTQTVKDPQQQNSILDELAQELGVNVAKGIVNQKGLNQSIKDLTEMFVLSKKGVSQLQKVISEASRDWKFPNENKSPIERELQKSAGVYTPPWLPDRFKQQPTPVAVHNPASLAPDAVMGGIAKAQNELNKLLEPSLNKIGATPPNFVTSNAFLEQLKKENPAPKDIPIKYFPREASGQLGFDFNPNNLPFQNKLIQQNLLDMDRVSVRTPATQEEKEADLANRIAENKQRLQKEQERKAIEREQNAALAAERIRAKKFAVREEQTRATAEDWSSLVPWTKSGRKAEILKEKDPDAYRRARSAMSSKVQSASLGASFILPMVGGAVEEFIPKDTKIGRGIGGTVSGLTNIASFAAMGGTLGGPWGAAIGGGLGAALSLPKMIKGFTDVLPDLERNFESLKDTIEKTSNSIGGIIRIESQLREARKSGSKISSDRFAELRAQQNEYYLSLKPEQQTGLRSALNRGGISRALEFEASVNEQLGREQKQAKFAIDLLDKKKLLKEVSSQSPEAQRAALTLKYNLPTYSPSAAVPSAQTRAIFAPTEEGARIAEGWASNMLSLRNKEQMGIFGEAYKNPAQYEDNYKKLANAFLNDRSKDTTEASTKESLVALTDFLNQFGAKGEFANIITALTQKSKESPKEFAYFYKLILEMLSPTRVKEAKAYEKETQTRLKEDDKRVEDFYLKLLKASQVVENFSVVLDAASQASIQNLQFQRERQLVRSRGYLDIQQQFSGPRTMNNLQAEQSRIFAEADRTTATQQALFDLSRSINETISTELLGTFQSNFQKALSNFGGEKPSDITDQTVEFFAPFQQKNEAIQERLMAGDFAGAKAALTDFSKSITSELDRLAPEMTSDMPTDFSKQVRELLQKLPQEIDKGALSFSLELEKIGQKFKQTSILIEEERIQRQNLINVQKKINVGGGIQQVLFGRNETNSKLEEALSTQNFGRVTNTPSITAQGDFQIADFYKSLGIDVQKEEPQLFESLRKGLTESVQQVFAMAGRELKPGQAEQIAEFQAKSAFPTEDDSVVGQLRKLTPALVTNTEIFNQFMNKAGGDGFNVRVKNISDFAAAYKGTYVAPKEDVAPIKLAPVNQSPVSLDKDFKAGSSGTQGKVYDWTVGISQKADSFKETFNNVVDPIKSTIEDTKDFLSKLSLNTALKYFEETSERPPKRFEPLVGSQNVLAPLIRFGVGAKVSNDYNPQNKMIEDISSTKAPVRLANTQLFSNSLATRLEQTKLTNPTPSSIFNVGATVLGDSTQQGKFFEAGLLESSRNTLKEVLDITTDLNVLKKIGKQLDEDQIRITKDLLAGSISLAEAESKRYASQTKSLKEAAMASFKRGTSSGEETRLSIFTDFEGRRKANELSPTDFLEAARSSAMANKQDVFAAGIKGSTLESSSATLERIFRTRMDTNTAFAEGNKLIAEETRLYNELGKSIKNVYEFESKINLNRSKALYENAVAGYKEGRISGQELGDVSQERGLTKAKYDTLTGADVYNTFRDRFRYNNQDWQRDIINGTVEIGETMKSSFSEGFAAFSTGAKDAKDAARDFGISVLQRISEIISNMAFNKLFNSAFSLGETAVSSIIKGSNQGGLIKGYSTGGKVKGGSGTQDDVPAMLSRGEFVVKRSSVQKYGDDTMQALNEGSLLMASGGLVQSPKNPKLYVGKKALAARKRMLANTAISVKDYNDTLGSETEKIPETVGKMTNTDVGANAITHYDLSDPNAISVVYKNAYAYNNANRPSAGWMNVDRELSILAQTDENNPANATKFRREEAMAQYLIDKDAWRTGNELARKAYERSQKQRLQGAWISAAATIAGGVAGKAASSYQANRAESANTVNGQQYSSVMTPDGPKMMPVAEGASTQTYGNTQWTQVQTNNGVAWYQNVQTPSTNYSSVLSRFPTIADRTADEYSKARRRNFGGILTYAAGGEVLGASTPQDTVPALLTGGEYVINKDSVRSYGVDFFQKLNRGDISNRSLRGYAEGGYVGNVSSTTTDNESSNRLAEAITNLLDVSQGLKDSFENKTGKGTQNQEQGAQQSDATGITNNVTINVTVQKDGQAKTETNTTTTSKNRSDSENAKNQADQLKTAVLAVLMEQKRPGGLLSK